MSEISKESRAHAVKLELAFSEEARLKFRDEMLEKAVGLAKAGKAEESYQKLLMVVAIDGVRDVLQGHIADAHVEKVAAEAATKQ